MELVSVRELRAQTAAVRQRLKQEGELVLTANGQPFGIIAATDAQHVMDDLLALRRVRAKTAVERIQRECVRQGLDKLTMDDIDAVIREVRRERTSAT